MKKHVRRSSLSVGGNLKLSQFLVWALFAAPSMPGAAIAMEQQQTVSSKKQGLLRRLVTDYKRTWDLRKKRKTRSASLAELQELDERMRRIKKQIIAAGLVAAFLAAIGVGGAVAYRKLEAEREAKRRAREEDQRTWEAEQVEHKREEASWKKREKRRKEEKAQEKIDRLQKREEIARQFHLQDALEIVSAIEANKVLWESNISNELLLIDLKAIRLAVEIEKSNKRFGLGEPSEWNTENKLFFEMVFKALDEFIVRLDRMINELKARPEPDPFAEEIVRTGMIEVSSDAREILGLVGDKEEFSWFEILGFDRETSDNDAVRKAYLQRAATVHPDKNPKEAATEAFAALSNAYAYFVNPKRSN